MRAAFMMCSFWSKPRRMTSAEPLVQLHHVTRRFAPNVVALDDITVSIATGKITALIGASGSGKTTLLRLIAGLDQPTSGTIAFAKPPRLAYVFQQPALLPWATVADNILLPVHVRATGGAADMSTVLSQVGLADKAQAMPHQLSGGQQMRVSIARALASAPDVMLLDEPFAALDEITRQKLCDLVVALSQQLGISLIFVTHNISEAVYVADDVIILASHPGRVAAQVQITAPVPRHASFRASAAYAQQCATLSAQLAEAMA
jgi:NitT/TauT family transport system ATP-binding protein